MNHRLGADRGATVISRLRIATAIGLLVLIILAGGNLLVGDQLRAISSFTKLQEGLFYMEYKGDYGLADFLKQGGAASDAELTAFLTRFFTKGLYKYEAPKELVECSTIAAELPGGGYGFGRNFDLDKGTALIIRTLPQSGYASISTTNINFLGFGQDLSAPGFMDKFKMLALVYAPLDGMNEKGLCVAVLAIAHGAQTNQDTEKPDLTTTAAVRLLLDRAADVDEALELLAQFDMHASVDTDYHFALADAKGRSVVVEYVHNEMHVVEAPVVTNHFLSPEYYLVGLGSNSQLRYKTLMEHLEAGNGVLSHEGLKNALAAAAQNGDIKTLWSIVYDLSGRRLAFYHLQDFENPLYFDFGGQTR
ncbi:MAG: linear amide C-N hydrolase [Firmicutes bacterium]|nr:linear amide C-N hydrolase [Bacillota bacterium]NLL88509.1 linear amide C-N hydrolase [Bacillota bacterium]HKM17150.1 C45 family peptidase [Limnochordia bacterium]